MGQYNPHGPVVLGQEWVPISEEDIFFDPNVKSVERGHGFTLMSPQTLQDGRFYMNTDLPSMDAILPMMISVYPEGLEDQTGPIQRVIIPCNGGSVTGADLAGAASVAEAVFNPSDGRYIFFGNNSTGDRAQLNFNVSAYTQLQSKRILGVNLLYTAGWEFDRDFGSFKLSLGRNTTTTIFRTDYGTLDRFEDDAPGALIISRKYLGEINPLWTANAPALTSDIMPWRYAEMLNFEPTTASGTRYALTFSFQQTSGGTGFADALLHYAALEVIYCAETRVAVGGRVFGDLNFNPGVSPLLSKIIYGANLIPMRNATTFADTPTLSSGAYSTTLTTPSVGDSSKIVAYPLLNGLRELYSTEFHRGIEIVEPTPIDASAVGLTFEREETHILPQISLHTSGGPFLDMHVYGRQAVAPVFGTTTALQDIDKTPLGGADGTYTQVRFYARRFGDTTVPLLVDSPNVTGSGLSAQITPAEFDVLTPTIPTGILDGFKEITLRFTNPLTLLSAITTPIIRWSAAGETAGNRWEVLGAQAPALSGVPGNLLKQVVVNQQLSAATYGQPASGASVNLTWLAPPLSGVSDDPWSDATVLLSQDNPTVTGMIVSQLTQSVTGIGLGCVGAPCCVPTGVGYQHIGWTPVVGTALDAFSRVVASGWGTADIGGDWAVGSTLGTGSSSVNGASGLHSITSPYPGFRDQILSSYLVTNVDTAVTFTVERAQSASLFAGILLRGLTSINTIAIGAELTATGAINLQISSASGVILGTVAAVDLVHSGKPLRLRVRAAGPYIMAKIWDPTYTEPDYWQISVNDSTTTPTAGVIGIRSTVNTSSTNTSPVVFAYDDFYAEPAFFGAYELQRQDDLTDWQTIMLGTSAAITGFNDFESRVNIASRYRIRVVNEMNFAGQWSVTISSTLASPGTSSSSTCADGTGVLIFTSNSGQSGIYTLAYTMLWDTSGVSEDFVFPEADTLKLQRMFQRDYTVGFKPTERGGEAFSRTILVQNAAIAPPRLADFKSLRDMMWADLPYVCVRDELGDRWLAIVSVPAGTVRRNRQDYYAQINVIEATTTSCTIDPAVS